MDPELQLDPTLFRLSMSFILIICFLGLIGNSLCIWVLLQREMRKSSYNFLLLGLGFSDFFLLLLGAIRTSGNVFNFRIDYTNPWIDRPIFFWDWICTGGTKNFTVAISLERCFVICYPLVAHRVISLYRAKMFSLSVFLYSVGIAALSYCYHYFWDPASFHVYTAVMLHFFPFLVVLILNFVTYLGFQRYRKERKLMTDSEANEVAITRMLLAIVVFFGFCYSFEFVRRILTFAGYFQKDIHYYDYTINHLADIFYCLNSAANFLIYYMLGTAFRAQFLKLIGNSCGISKSFKNNANSKPNPTKVQSKTESSTTQSSITESQN